MKRVLSAACFPVGVVVCAVTIMVWAREAAQAMLVPFFALGAGVFFVLTVQPQNRASVMMGHQDVMEATDCYHVAMALGGVCLGSAAGSAWILVARMDWVPLGAIYCSVMGSVFFVASFRGLRYYFMRF